MLTAFYDLALSPPTFDFVAFLVAAERRRIELGEESLRVILVPGPDHGFRRDQLPPRDPAVRLGMLNRIVQPLCALLPTCEGVWLRERAAVDLDGPVFPDHADTGPRAHYGLNVLVANAAAGCFPLVARRPAVLPPRSITITLREAPYHAARNSNRTAWLAAAEALRAQGWNPVFVPDTFGPPLPMGIAVDPVAAVDLTRRANLYAGAALNLFVNNGPAWMATFMAGVPMIMLKMLEESCPATTRAHFAGAGLPEGAQLGRPGHWIEWADDTVEAILRAIEPRGALR